MPALQVDSFFFTFTPAVAAQRYDTWQHYTTVWNASGGQKGVDVVSREIRSGSVFDLQERAECTGTTCEN